MSLTPQVSVIIPTHDSREVLAHALGALRSEVTADHEVVVVDSASTDGTADMVRTRFPWVRVERLEVNEGFARAVNAGIRVARGDLIVLLNDDTEVAPGWLSALIAPLRHDPTVASCASRILDFYERTRIDSAGDQLGLVASQLGHGERDGIAFDQPREVLSACAAAAAYRRSALAAIGGFDESYGSYLEDVDVGIRLMLQGYRCVYVPEAIVFHRGAQTSARLPDRRFYLVMRNTLVLFGRHMPWERLIIGLPVMIAMPFAAAWRDGQPFSIAWRALRDALLESPAIVRYRRRMRSQRRVPVSTLRQMLVSPFTWQAR